MLDIRPRATPWTHPTPLLHHGVTARALSTHASPRTRLCVELSTTCSHAGNMRMPAGRARAHQHNHTCNMAHEHTRHAWSDAHVFGRPEHTTHARVVVHVAQTNLPRPGGHDRRPVMRSRNLRARNTNDNNSNIGNNNNNQHTPTSSNDNQHQPGSDNNTHAWRTSACARMGDIGLYMLHSKQSLLDYA